MSIFLFFDTETKGFLLNKNTRITDVNDIPKMEQLAYIICDENEIKVSSDCFLIATDEDVISCEVSKIKNESDYKRIILSKIRDKKVFSLLTVLHLFDKLVQESDYLIGHNIRFDEKIISAEFIRNNVPNNIPNKHRICTMKSTVKFCAIQGNDGGFKYPKLSELYYKLFGHYFENAHRADSDVQATMECFWELKRKGVIKLHQLRNDLFSDNQPYK